MNYGKKGVRKKQQALHSTGKKWSRKVAFAFVQVFLIAMIGGRVVWGAVRVLMLGMGGSSFSWQMFMAGAFLNAIPGIILQLVFIPALMVALNRTGLVPFHRAQNAKGEAEGA